MTRWRSVTSDCKQPFNQHLQRDRRADPYEHLRNLASDRQRHVIVAEALRESRHQRVAISRQPLGRIGGEFGSSQRIEQRGHDLFAHDDRRRRNRLPRDRIPRIRNQPDEQIGEQTGHERQDARGLQPIRNPLLPLGVRHRLEQHARGIEILRRPRRGEKRRHSGADGEVLDVAKLLELPKRIDTHFAGHVQQRFGPDPQIGIAQHVDRLAADRRVSRRAQHRQRAAPDVGFRDATAAAAPDVSSPSMPCASSQSSA